MSLMIHSFNKIQDAHIASTMAQNDDIKVRNMLDKIAVEQNFEDPKIEIKAITSGGANYSSQLFVATISGKNRDDLNAFVKVASMGAKMREQTKMQLYSTELFVYTDLLKSYRDIEARNGLAEKHRLKLPAYYGANTTELEEVLVLENLISRGFGSHDRLKSIDWPYAEAAVTELAKFHALSMVYEEENPEKFEQVVQNLGYPEFDENVAKMMFSNAVAGATAAAKPEYRGRLSERLKTFRFNEFIELSKPLRRPVLVHGDYRASNMLHKTRPNGTVELIPVDYQTLRAGSPVVDLYYFIFSGTDKEFRAQYHQRLLNHYYAELRASLIRLRLDPDAKYSRSDYEYELKEKMPYGLAMAVVLLPIVTVEAENAPKVDQAANLSDFSLQKTGNQYPARLNGIIEDYIRWGEL